MANGDDDLEARGLIAHSYSNFFKIRKRMRKLQDISLPFRRGLGVEQFVTFLLVLFLLLVIYGTLVAPLFALTGIKPNWQFFLIYFMAPSVLAGSRVGKPMKSGKTIPGTIRSWVRKTLDDPVHRRGVPLRRRPVTGRRAHYVRTWQAHPVLAAYLPRGATYAEADGQPERSRVELDAWLGQAVTEFAAQSAASGAGDDAADHGRGRYGGRVVVPDEFDLEDPHERYAV